MPLSSPRQRLWLCAGLDFWSCLLALALINVQVEPDLWNPINVVVGVPFVYCLFSWLLGGYILLRWPWLRMQLVLQRLLLIPW